MNNKLKKIRLTLSYTQDKFANKLNCPISTYRSYEYGSRNFSTEFIQSLINKFNINANWLFCGIGEMFINECSNSRIECDNKKALNNFEKFHKRLNQLQSENNLNDYEFAKKIGITESRLEKIGIGKVKPNLDELNCIKQHFDVSIDWLLYGETPVKNAQNEIALSEDDIIKLKKLAKNINF